jgi:fibronectin type 3 domain-containing protein
MNTLKSKMMMHFFTVMVFMMLLAACPDDPEPITSVPTAPAVPTNVRAEAKSSTSITITWSSVSGATSYDVHYEPNSRQMTKVSTVTGTLYTHNGLQPNTAYKYYVAAKNNIGTSDLSSSNSVTTPLNDAAGQKPAAPTGVTAAAVSSGSVRLTWSPVQGATSYDVHYTVGSSSNKGFAANVASSPYTHSGLQPNTTYKYYVTAINSAGTRSDFSSSDSVVTPGGPKPAAPTGVTAAVSSSSVRVTWSPVSGATSYDVYCTVDSSSNSKNFVASVTSPPYTHSGLQPNTTYYYFITARNSAGESDFSSPASVVSPNLPAVTKPTAPTGVTATLQSSSTVRVTWNPVSGATSYDVYYAFDRSAAKKFVGNVTGTAFSQSVSSIKAVSLFYDTNNTTDVTISRIVSQVTHVFYYVKARNSAGESDFSSHPVAVSIPN